MQSLMGGAECGTSSNPLKQVAQREGVDNSLFKDRLTQGPASSQSAFRPGPGPSAAHPAPLHRPLHANPTPHPFNLSHLSAALSQSQSREGSASPAPAFDAQWEHAQRMGYRPGTSPGPAMAAGPAQWAPAQGQRSAWTAGFDEFQASGKGKSRAAPPPQAPQGYQPQAQQSGYTGYGGGMSSMFGAGGGMYAGMSGFQPAYGAQGYAQPPQVNGQARVEAMGEKEMDDLFAQAEVDWQDAEKGKEAGAGETKEADKEDVKTGEESAAPEEETREAKGDFDAVWESLKPEAERLNKLAEWENDFSQFTHDEDDLFDILNESLNRDDVGQHDLDQQLHLDGLGEERAAFERDGTFQSADGIPQMSSYEFAADNVHDSMSASFLWAESNRILSSGGALSSAASMLESFIQRSNAQERAQIGVSATEAWALLGRVHAMDEKEEKALASFQEGRKVLQEEGAGGKEAVAGEMLTNLAISYVNETLDLAALTTLHSFLSLLHPTHAGPAPSVDSSLLSDSPSPWALHQQMTDSFLALAREQYQKAGVVDPDVQVGLGTLFYMMGEYGQARDCWVAALKERPDDYLLWNRLGATLANGGSSEEAVDAYRRALELKPTFTRAISNLGVACMNIGVHKEAAEHFLAALSLHPATQDNPQEPFPLSNDSASLWTTLRKSLVAMDLHDLAGKARPGTDLEVFRRAGFDF
ncbi:hypothetical protein IAT38_002579 [Cryptococcus sp. DSM 104549]